jgi:hypothetical protein
MMEWSQEHKDWVGPQSYSSNNTLENMIYTTIQANMQETLFYLFSCKKFFLALIFWITKLYLNRVTKVGVLQVFPS